MSITEARLWTEQEDQILLQQKSRQATDKEIGEQLARSEESVRSRRRRLSRNLNEEAPRVRSSRNIDHPPVYLKAAIFDLETMSFTTAGVQDHLVCCSVLPLNEEEPTTYSIKFEDHRDDRRLLKEVIEALSQFDILIGHNAKAYDLNWLESRAMYFGFPQLPSWLVYDTYQASKTMAIKADSKSLGALGAYFGVKGDKTRVFKTDWSYIDSPILDEFDEAMENIVEHCEGDVILNRGVFYALWRYDPQRRLSKTKW
ncbi:MAG TPA: ribonuclease H-like domain-containing protein [Candidatus Hodarchaeales archaeon]|nr:ribonuclease H-like domain-containing protein [Candidatus Hodarchaeales archaeon]